MKKPTLIIISGFPATGKTTIAKKLSEHFSLPLVCVDELKEMIFDRIGNWEDEQLFYSVSKASYDLMYYTASSMLSMGQSCIIEAFLRAKMAEPRIAKLREKYSCQLLQFQLNTDFNKLIERYDARHNSKERHPCHPGNIPREEFIKLKGKSKMVKIGRETVVLDTTDFEKIDWQMIFKKVKEKLDWKKSEFLKTLSQKRVAAGILLFNENNELLLLKPTYKERWTIPGGVIEENEFLVDGLKREIKEEIGIEVEIKNLLVVDSKIIKEGDHIDESLQMIFSSQVLANKQIKKIRLAKDEISEFKFVSWEEALKLLNSSLSKRISNIKKGQKETILLNNGEKI